MNKVHYHIRLDTWIAYLLSKGSFGILDKHIIKWFDKKYPINQQQQGEQLMNIKNTIKSKLNIPTDDEKKNIRDLESVQTWTFHASCYTWYDPYVHHTHSGMLFEFLGTHLPRVGEHVGITASWLTPEHGYYGAARFAANVHRIETVVNAIHHNMWGGGTIDLEMTGLWERDEDNKFCQVFLPTEEQDAAWEQAKTRRYI